MTQQLAYDHQTLRSGALIAMTLFALTLFATVLTGHSDGSEPQPDAASTTEASMLLVIGAAGTDEYARRFDEWADRWESAAAIGQTAVTIIGRGATEAPDHDVLKDAIAAELEPTDRPLWIVLIGHGTFDGRQARFNLRGQDVSAAEIAEWLGTCERPVTIINCASASAPFIDRLAGDDRIVITSTKTGSEANFSLFGDYLSQAISDHSADLDKDAQVSLLEAFLMASRQTQSWYDGQRRLATEHALLEDNGDARGARADFFTGIEPAQQTADDAPIDGNRAHQWHLIPSDEERRIPPEVRQQRNAIELQLQQLKSRKSEFSEDEYYSQIEPLLVQIARLYESLDAIPSDESPATSESLPDDAPESSGL